MTNTFPHSVLLVSAVVIVILFNRTSLESEFISSMILFKLTPLKSSGANEKSVVGCWISLMIDVNNFLMVREFIGLDHEPFFSTRSLKKKKWKKNEYICTVCKCHQRTQFFNVIISHRQLKHDITYFYPNHLISNRYNIAWTRIFYFTKLSMGLLSSDNSIFKLHFPCKWFTIPEMFYFLILRRSPFGHCISTVLSTFANRSLSVFSQLVRSPHGWYVLIDRTVLVYNSGGFFLLFFGFQKWKCSWKMREWNVHVLNGDGYFIINRLNTYHSKPILKRLSKLKQKTDHDLKLLHLISKLFQK